MAGKRATKLEKQFRIAEFVRLLSRGYVNSQLIQFASDEWGVGERHAREYIAEAREVVIADVNQDRKVVVAELLATSRTVIQEALKKGEFNNVIGAMNLITRLGGLAPDK